MIFVNHPGKTSRAAACTNEWLVLEPAWLGGQGLIQKHHKPR
jgi:hypothetical protein